MNRAQRRAVSRQAHQLDLIRLDGGPMDKWLVKPGAAVLLPEWGEAYVEDMGAVGIEAELGHYERGDRDEDGVEHWAWIAGARA